jgi:flagellar protein FliS
MYARAANIYRKVDLDSAPNTQIVERLYERFARDIETARTAIAARDIKGKAAALDHAMRIVSELRCALDHAKAPDLCAKLDSLYRFVIDKINESNAKLDAKPLDHAERVMASLGAGFRGAYEKMK